MLLSLSDQATKLFPDECAFLSTTFQSMSSNVKQMPTDVLVATLKAFNLLYRAGCPAIPDVEYDTVFRAELQHREPSHPYLHTVEPEGEGAFEGKVVDLSQRMLSTDKAYSEKEISAWILRVTKAATAAGLNPHTLVVEITPKLDGFASLDNGDSLVTRGNGYRGTDISRVFERGLQVGGTGQRGLGPGEIVVDVDYFDEHLINYFDNTRNFQSSVIKEGELSSHTQKAVDDGAVVFFPFSELPRWTGRHQTLMADFESIVDSIWDSMPYDVDGVVLEVPVLREIMGHTSDHHRNTIAFKRNDKEVPVPVTAITFQTAKSGRITPVAELEPTLIGGAELTRATLHNVGWAEKMGVGAGSICGIVRAGKVIPKVVSVHTHAALTLPTACPSCDSDVYREEHNLYCSNTLDCPAQIESRLAYFFKTLGNCDGFGDKTLESINACSDTLTVEGIYAMTVNDFTAMDFGVKTSENLVSELERSRQTPVEDWRFLASFSLHSIGRGGCERLLKAHKLDTIFDLTFDDIEKIEGFASKKADALLTALARIKSSFLTLRPSFNLMLTVLSAEADAIVSPIVGKVVVFSGTMTRGKRSDMEKSAKALGAKVSGSVTGNTDYLVTGLKVGASKIAAAEKNGTTLLTEDAYLELLKGS